MSQHPASSVQNVAFLLHRVPTKAAFLALRGRRKLQAVRSKNLQQNTEGLLEKG